MKRAFLLVLVMVFALLIACGEKTEETPVDSTLVETPAVETVTPDTTAVADSAATTEVPAPAAN